MKKRVCMSFLALSLLVSAMAMTPAYAQSHSSLVAHIPFDFYIGDKMIPAGEYSVRRVSDDGAQLLISSADGRENVLVLTHEMAAKASKHDEASLIFNKYGDELFLSAAWNPGSGGRALIASARERRLKKELRMTQSAGTSSVEPQVVTIAAHYEGN
ncbi:MAG: hypothetical protein LC754_17755 [Acidobacteria bacterium]|nr:hypothetical protein [Acidobacteriota bacterium]